MLYLGPRSSAPRERPACDHLTTCRYLPGRGRLQLRDNPSVRQGCLITCHQLHQAPTQSSCLLRLSLPGKFELANFLLPTTNTLARHHKSGPDSTPPSYSLSRHFHFEDPFSSSTPDFVPPTSFRMSVIIRRRRPKRAQRNLLDLPAEILATVWQYVLNTPKGDQEHHIYFNRSCMSHNGSLMWKKIEQWRFRFQERIKYLLFSRWVCPPLVLVNKQIYREALTYLSHAQTFEVGDEECLRSFISLAPNQLIPSSTAFDAGYVE